MSKVTNSIQFEIVLLDTKPGVSHFALLTQCRSVDARFEFLRK